MFGAGLYFAEHASKSQQYVHSGTCKLSGAMPRDPTNRAKFIKDCKCKQKDECCVLLCRVALGDCLIEKNFRGNGPGQFWHARRREPCARRPFEKKKIPLSSGSRSVSAVRREKPGGGVYNSVIGESRANGGSALEFREYILYESKQVYPE